MKSIWIALAIIGCFVLLFLNLPMDGEIDIKSIENTVLFKDSGLENSDWQPINALNFYWSNNYLTIGKGGEAGNNKTTHLIFIQVSIVITNEEGQKIAIIKELNQWQSTPNDWNYIVFNPDDYAKVAITSKNLLKIKRQLTKRPELNS